jgi:ATP-dependent exoDNAse (exonuclease V) beta subunit
MELVQHALDTSGWYATLALDERREQILANVEKAMELIRSAVDGTGGTLYDAVTALSPINGDRERDGFVPSNGDAVRVMTIHASKGLEFGIVVLGGLATKGRPHIYLSTDEVGVSFSIATDAIDPVVPGTIEELPVVKTHVMAKQRTVQRETAEFRRRLYVALTRAKAHLTILHAADELHGELPGMGGVLGSALSTARNHVTIVADHTSGQFADVAEERNEIVLLDHVEQPNAELVAPTQFMHAHRWTEDGERSVEGDTAGAAYGIAVHDVVATTLPAALRLDHAERLALIARSLSTHQLDRDRATEAALEISGLFDSQLVTANAEILREARREVRLISTLDDVAIQGILDCRLMHADGSMSVWDWKTNAVRDETDIDTLARVYHRQMQTYAWLCLQAYPTCDSVTTRLVFTKAIVQGLASVDRAIEWRRSQLADIELDLRAALAELRTGGDS